MKKFIIFILSILISSCCISSSQKASASNTTSNEMESTYGYYKCLSSCLLFKTSDITDMDISNILFIIPEGYFVKKINQLSSTTMQVSYMNKTGYVMTERIYPVSFIPENKYLEHITFDISTFSGTQLWSVPSSEDSSKVILKLIPAGTQKVSYIAEARGEIPVGSSSSVWYYCYFSPLDDPTSVFEGYIHSEKTTNRTIIPENLEGAIIEPNDELNTQQSIVTLSSTVQVILIALISLPLLTIIVILLLSGRRKEKIEQHNSKDDYHKFDNEQIIREKPRSATIESFKNKKFSLKNSFEKFMYDEQPPRRNNQTISFDTLDENDDDLL